MLEEGYLELLAPTMDTPHAQRVRDAMKRFVGVHLACFGTPDAAAEHARLGAHGFEPEPVVDLQRKIETGDSVGFSVVYVPPGKMPEGRVQYCEHLTPQHVWREGFVNPFRLRAVYVVADEPEEVAARWGRFGGLLPRPEDGFVRLDTARGQRDDRNARALSPICWVTCPRRPRSPAMHFPAAIRRHSRRAAARPDL